MLEEETLGDILLTMVTLTISIDLDLVLRVEIGNILTE